jgi:hypothetical protein
MVMQEPLGLPLVVGIAKAKQRSGSCSNRMGHSQHLVTTSSSQGNFLVD